MGADLEGVEAGEDVKERDGDFGGAGDHRGVLDGDEVEPACAAGAAGGGAELAAALADAVADGVALFGGEWPCADAGGVGLGDADDA